MSDMKTMFPRELLLELLESGKFVEENIIGTSRWSIRYEVVFRMPGERRYFRTTYRVGATEMQGEQPWEGQDMVECEEVKAVPVIKMTWVPVEAKFGG
jgi:hypothetical protein